MGIHPPPSDPPSLCPCFELNPCRSVLSHGADQLLLIRQDAFQEQCGDRFTSDAKGKNGSGNSWVPTGTCDSNIKKELSNIAEFIHWLGSSKTNIAGICWYTLGRYPQFTPIHAAHLGKYTCTLSNMPESCAGSENH